MKKIIHIAAIAAGVLGLAACGTESAENEETLTGAEDPVDGEGDQDAGPLIADAEAGRPAFDEAMRIGCPDAAVGRVECTNTGTENEYSCEYELIDGEGEVLTTTIRRDGDAWSLAETPAHCEPA